MTTRRGTATLLLASCTALAVSMAGTPAGADAQADLHALFDQEWEYALEDNPLFATSLGDTRYNRRWRDMSLSAFEERNRHDRQVLSRLAAIDTSGLSETDRLNHELFLRGYEDQVESRQYRWYLLPLNQRGGIQTAPEIAAQIRFLSVNDYEDWIARMKALPEYMDQTIALMREGIRTRMVHPRVIMERIPAQIAAQIVDEPESSQFYEPFESFPDTVPAGERRRLEDEAKRVVREVIVPTYRTFEEFFTTEYLPACFDKVGAWQMPDGQELYAARARMFTTTDLTPKQIHEIGLSEVKRIRGQMQEIIEKVEFEGDFAAFLEFLRNDPRFYHESPDELLEAYRALTRRIDPTLVRVFRTMPRMPYGVEPIPDNVAPDTTTAYYQQPAADGSRAGTYFVNLYRPEVRPTYEMEALSLHEAVPGHHFQIALAQELGELPAFRRYTAFTAFTEGWGLYAESLGDELGFYEDPYSKFGQLTYEMWRAVRLVVDTGMHSLQWSRQRAIDFFMDNAAKTEHDIVNEIDRYIAWPGQALAYKIGELKIKELRARGEERLGDRFDLRAFHEVVLGSGAVPLDVLEKNVDRWIASRTASAADQSVK